MTAPTKRLERFDSAMATGYITVYSEEDRNTQGKRRQRYEMTPDLKKAWGRYIHIDFTRTQEGDGRRRSVQHNWPIK